MAIKNVDTIEQLGPKGKAKAKTLETAANAIEREVGKRNIRLGEFLAACRAESIMLKQKHTAKIAGCDQSMVSRLANALGNRSEMNDKAPWADGIAELKELGYSKFVETYVPSKTSDKQADTDPSMVDEGEGEESPQEKVAAKVDQDSAKSGSVDNLTKNIGAFNRAFADGKVAVSLEELTELEIALHECLNLVSSKSTDLQKAVDALNAKHGNTAK